MAAGPQTSLLLSPSAEYSGLTGYDLQVKKRQDALTAAMKIENHECQRTNETFDHKNVLKEFRPYLSGKAQEQQFWPFYPDLEGSIPQIHDLRGGHPLQLARLNNKGRPPDWAAQISRARAVSVWSSNMPETIVGILSEKSALTED